MDKPVAAHKYHRLKRLQSQATLCLKSIFNPSWNADIQKKSWMVCDGIWDKSSLMFKSGDWWGHEKQKKAPWWFSHYSWIILVVCMKGLFWNRGTLSGTSVCTIGCTRSWQRTTYVLAVIQPSKANTGKQCLPWDEYLYCYKSPAVLKQLADVMSWRNSLASSKIKSIQM